MASMTRVWGLRTNARGSHAKPLVEKRSVSDISNLLMTRRKIHVENSCRKSMATNYASLYYRHMLIGYARVSTTDQNPDHQTDALTRAGVNPANIYLDHAIGAKASRP